MIRSSIISALLISLGAFISILTTLIADRRKRKYDKENRLLENREKLYIQLIKVFLPYTYDPRDIDENTIQIKEVLRKYEAESVLFASDKVFKGIIEILHDISKEPFLDICHKIAELTNEMRTELCISD